MRNLSRFAGIGLIASLFLLSEALLSETVAAQVLTPLPSDTARMTTLTYGLGGQVGFFKSSGADAGALYLGAVGRMRFGSAFGLEATLGYRGEQSFNFGRVNGADLSAKAQSIPITFSAVLKLPFQGSLLSYVLGGAGLYFTTIDYSADVNKVLADETVTKAGLHLGVGLEYPLNSGIGLHADYRYLFLGSIFSSNPTYDFSSKDYGGSQFTAGFLVYF